jgi:hypothetical protein
LSEWLSGAFALSGITVGWALNAVTDFVRRKREARLRWNDLRRELAVRFLAATERVWVWSNNFTNVSSAERMGVGLSIEGGATYEDVMAKIAEADRDVRSLDTEIQLIGSDAEREAAHRLREAAWSVGSAYAAYQRVEEGDREDRRRVFDQSRVYECTARVPVGGP